MKNAKYPDSTQIYSIFILHYQKKLTPIESIKVEKIINECEECNNIYKEIECFFDEEDLILFELNNSDEIEKLKKQSERKMLEICGLPTVEVEERDYDFNLDENLHCCGS